MASIPRWALGDGMMFYVPFRTSHSEILKMNLRTRKPALYENESRSLMTTSPQLDGDPTQIRPFGPDLKALIELFPHPFE